MTPQQSAAELSATVAAQEGVLRINVQALSKAERKELHQVVGAFGAACTVKMARGHCSPGPVMTAVYTVLTMAFFAGLAVLFLPLLLCAVLAPVVVPMRVAKSKARWLQLLPPERDADRLELI
jgi:hypothetical protein